MGYIGGANIIFLSNRRELINIIRKCAVASLTTDQREMHDICV